MTSPQLRGALPEKYLEPRMGIEPTTCGLCRPEAAPPRPSRDGDTVALPQPQASPLMAEAEPPRGFEPRTYGLRYRCSTS